MPGVPGPRGGAATTTSGRRPASSTARSGARRARPGCSAWTSTRSTAAAGQRDFRFNAVLVEEIVAPGCSGLGFGLHNDVVAPYLTELTTDGAAQALAARLLLRRHRHRDRDERAGRRLRPRRRPHDRGPRRRRVRPQRTEDVHHQRRAWPTWSSSWRRPRRTQGAHGVSLIAVERGTPGFTRGRRLEKVGLKANDTAELFFDDCRVPADNLHRHGEPRLLPPDGQPAPGAARHRGRRGGRGRARCWR